MRRLVGSSRHELAQETSGFICAEPNVGPVIGDLDPFDQQMDDARLLDREDFVPEWVELQQRIPVLAAELP